MSILNAFISPEVAYVGSDSLAVHPNGSIADLSKLLVIPHLNAVVGFRGINTLMQIALPALWGHPGSYEELVEAIPSHIEGALRYAEDNGLAGDERINCYDLLLVGYSAARGRIDGHLFRKTLDTEAPEVLHDIPSVFLPWEDDWDMSGVKIAPNAAGLAEIAKFQAEKSAKFDPQFFAVGGRFYVAEVRRDSIWIEKPMVYNN